MTLGAVPVGFSVFCREGRPTWRIKYVGPRGAWVHETTPYRVDDAGGRRKAILLAERKAKDYAPGRLGRRTERWSAWVETFLASRYRGSPRTLQRYLGAWRQWIEFLADHQLAAPAALDYNHVVQFVAWREARPRHCGKIVSRNTALCDVKVMSLVIREAVRRGFALGNPCERLGIRKDPAKEKAPLSLDEIARIRAAVAERECDLPLPRRWMTISFEIALHQGCRLTETSLPLTAINEQRREIMFLGKGRNGQKKQIVTALHPALLPLIAELRAAGASHTCTLPAMAAKEWWALRQQIGLGHTTFHATRVTVITELSRQGVTEAQAMRYVGHSSRLVHRVYQKLRPADLDACVAALNFSQPSPPAPPSTAENPGAPSSSGAASKDSPPSGR